MFLKFMFLRIVSPFLMILVVKGTGGQHESTLLNDLQAECTQEGINVKLFFRQPFSGVAYSHGHYETPKCRYISQEDQVIEPSGTNFSFLIPINECGTVYHGGLGTPLRRLRTTRDATNENQVYIENTLLVQNDPTIQEAGDLAKTLRCVWQKEIHKPLIASLPFGNVNPKLNPVRFPSGEREKTKEVPYRNRTNSASPTSFNKGRLRFQMKGQVQSVPAYRRHHSRSLPIGDQDNDQTTQSSPIQDPTEVLRDQETEDLISALPLKDHKIGTSNGSSTLKQSTPLLYTKFALTLTLSLMTSLVSRGLRFE